MLELLYVQLLMPEEPHLVNYQNLVLSMDLFGQFDYTLDTYLQDWVYTRPHSDTDYAALKVWQIWTKMDP